MSRIENDVMGTEVLQGLVKEILAGAINMTDVETATKMQTVKQWFLGLRPSVSMDVEGFIRRSMPDSNVDKIRAAIDIIVL